MNSEFTDLIVGFGENLDAYAKWDAKVPPFLKVIDTLMESEMIVSHPLAKGGFRYSLVNM